MSGTLWTLELTLVAVTGWLLALPWVLVWWSAPGLESGECVRCRLCMMPVRRRWQ